MEWNWQLCQESGKKSSVEGSYTNKSSEVQLSSSFLKAADLRCQISLQSFPVLCFWTRYTIEGRLWVVSELRVGPDRKVV